MISEKLKNRLAVENGEECSDKRYIDLVRAGGKKGFDLEDEMAILRKIIHELLGYIEVVHPDVVATEVYKEFEAYNEHYEQVKAEAKSILAEYGGAK